MQASTSRTTLPSSSPSLSPCSVVGGSSPSLSPLTRPQLTEDARRWGTKRVRINQVYQEYISDKSHLHMNATRWLSLTEFTKHLGRSGIAHVDENEKGWFVSWIDNSPKALAKAEASQKKERGDIDDESRQRKLIEEQIARARMDGQKRKVEAAGGVWDGVQAEEEEVRKELVRSEGEKVHLSLNFKVAPAAAAATSTPSLPSPPTSTTDESTSAPPLPPASTLPTSTTSFIPPPTKAPTFFTPKPNAFKTQPLKRLNPLKANPLKSNPLKSSSSSASTSGTKRPAPQSAVEAIIEEEMRRKERREGGGPGSEPWKGEGRDGGLKKARY